MILGGSIRCNPRLFSHLRNNANAGFNQLMTALVLTSLVKRQLITTGISRPLSNPTQNVATSFLHFPPIFYMLHEHENFGRPVCFLNIDCQNAMQNDL